MAIHTFQSRLRKAMREGNLTIADLARWFERPHPTTRSWVKLGVDPAGGPQDREWILKRLEKLEDMIEAGKCFPVPRLSPSARIAYLAKLSG